MEVGLQRLTDMCYPPFFQEEFKQYCHAPAFRPVWCGHRLVTQAEREKYRDGGEYVTETQGGNKVICYVVRRPLHRKYLDT